MSRRPLQLGPGPNRTYLERWNEMHPDRYGKPDSPVDADHGWQREYANNDTDAGGGSGRILNSLVGLAILVLAPLAGAIATLFIYRRTAPDQLTTAWILGYAGIFLATTWTGATLVYALRRLLLAAAIAAITLGVGYIIWTL